MVPVDGRLGKPRTRPYNAAPMNEPTHATVAFQSLEPDDILKACESLGFDVNGRLLALNSYENRVYRIGVGHRDNVIVKFYRPERWADDAILEEHRFAAELADAELPVVAPLRIGGATLHHSGHFRLAAFPNRGGRPPDLDRLDQLEQLGRLVGQIHNVGAVEPFQARPAIDIESFGSEAMNYLLDAGFIPPELEQAYESVADAVLDEVEAAFERAGATTRLRLHGDFHPGNVLVDEDRFHLVDLDDARSGPAVQDLWMFLSGGRDEMEPQLGALLSGYTAFRDFPANELCLVEALRSLRIIHYAAWLARRWDDPAFQIAFPWFAARRYWDEHVLALREQIALLQEPPLAWREYR